MITEYGVNGVANLLGVSGETVKRWIRSGKLKGEYEAKRYGYVIKVSDLEEFVESDPKYKKMLNRDVDRAFINFCKEFLIDIYSIEAKNLGEEHGKVWNEGFNRALNEVETRLKSMIIEHETPLNAKSRHYSKAG